MLQFLLFTKRVYFNGNGGVEASAQKHPPFSLSLSTWDQSSFIINHFHFIFITYVTYTQFLQPFVCVSSTKPHCESLSLSLSRFMCGDEKSTFSFTFDGTLLYLFVRRFIWWSSLQCMEISCGYIWHLLCKHFITLPLNLSRVCVYVWEISLYSHWLLCRWCYDSVLKM